MLFLNFYSLLTFCCLIGDSYFARDLPTTINIPNQGIIVGKEISLIRTQRIIAYLGIPYAQPPLDYLRFAPPSTNPLPSWEGIRNTTEYAPACLQSDKNFKQEELAFLKLISDRNFEVNEDCLYLNIFRPYEPSPKEGFATIVWLHPGHFVSGSPNMWNPYTLVYKQRVIVVTLSYRLNIMGFFTTMDGESPGNYGIMDQQAALAWIKNNIELFGGNPDNICLMGYGAGALSIGHHMINEQSRNYFHKVILMSGNIFSPADEIKYPHDYKQVLDDLAEFFGCFRTPTSALMACLRRADANALVSYTSKVNWKPIIDQELTNTSYHFLPEHPRNYFERGDFYKVPILTGYTDMGNVLKDIQNLSDDLNEEFMQNSLMEITKDDLPQVNNDTFCVYNHELIMDSVKFFYKPSIPTTDTNKIRKIVTDIKTDKQYGAWTYLLASFMSKDRPVYVYRFDTRPSTNNSMADIPEWVSVPYLFDLIFVWGIPYWGQLPNNTQWDIRDKRTSDIIMLFWTNFAKYSDPTESTIFPIEWGEFTKENPGILIIDRAFNMSDVNRLNYKAFEFWIDYYPKIVRVGSQCCNATDGSDAFDRIQNKYLITVVIGFVILRVVCSLN